MRHLAIALLLPAVALIGCGNVEAQQAAAAHAQRLIEEHHAAQDAASQKLAAADQQPSVETLLAVLPLMNAGNLNVTFRGSQMQAFSATRQLMEQHPELAQRALFQHLESLGAQLPEGEVLPETLGSELHSYLKVLTDAVVERALLSGVPSMTCLIKVQAEDGTERQLTVGYLYPYGEYRMGDRVVVQRAMLPELLAQLRRGLQGGG